MKNLLLTLVCIGIFSCTYDEVEEPEVCDKTYEIVQTESRDSKCDAADGGFTLSVTLDGTLAQNLTFTLNGAEQSSGEFDDLSAGSYNVSISDGVCTQDFLATVNNSEGFQVTTSLTDVSCNGDLGSISISVTEETGALTYSLDGGEPQSNSTFEGLAAGDYVIEIKDESACAVVLNLEVKAELVYTDIAPIIETNCAISGCHAGDVAPNLSTKSGTINRATRIKARTGALTMPPSSSGLTLSEEQIEQIACWVDAGAPE